jgi:hypothetical protein
MAREVRHQSTDLNLSFGELNPIIGFGKGIRSSWPPSKGSLSLLAEPLNLFLFFLFISMNLVFFLTPHELPCRITNKNTVTVSFH